VKQSAAACNMEIIENGLETASLKDTEPPVSDLADVDSTLEKLKNFCKLKDITTAGAIALTIQRNRTGQYASLIADFENGTLHEVYPRAFNQIYKEGPVTESQEFLYCFHAGLDALPLRAEVADSPIPTNAAAAEADSPFAFCCDNLEPYRPRRTQNDRVFDAFVSGVGEARGLLFEVKRQVDNGRLISTAVFELRDGKRVRVQPSGPLSKVHSFKNFKCVCHNRFFGVDLCKVGDGHSNAHHLRCVAFAKRDAALEEAFFTHHGCDAAA